MTSPLYEDLCTFMPISRGNLLKMKNVSDEICREYPNTHFILNNILRKSCRLLDNVEIYNTARQATDDNVTWRTRFAG